MKTGALTIGTMVLNETNVLRDSTGSDGRVINVVGRESSCDGPVDPLKSNIMGLPGKILPVQFEYKSSYNGYYTVVDANVDYEKWYQGSTLVQWNMSLGRLGPDNAVDLESRVSNVMRNGRPGERWHAPAGGHTTYFVGAVTLSKITRTSSDGPITVYRAVPANTNPLWSCPVTGYAAGRSRFLQDGIERLATRFEGSIAGWELSNGLLRIKPSTTAGTTLLVAFYDGTAWREKAWDIRSDGTAFTPATHFHSVSVIRNNAEVVTVRILAIHPINGNRVIIDLTLRRGARFVEGYVQQTTSGTISAQLNVAELFTSFTYYTVANAVDVNGAKSVAGSSKTITLAGNGGVSLVSTTTLDFWIGVEFGGDPGDAAAIMQDHYIASMPETVGVIRR